MRRLLTKRGSRPVRLEVEWLESRDCPTELFNNGLQVLVGTNPAGVQEAAVPVHVGGINRGDFQVVEQYFQVAGTGSFPLDAADLVSSGFIRLTPQMADGTTAALGTSLLGSFSFRTGGQLRLVPTVTRADVTIPTADTATIVLTTVFGAMATQTITHRYARPAIGRTTAEVEVSVLTGEAITLEAGLLGKDAARLLTASSMFSSVTQYDGNVIRWRDPLGTEHEFRLTPTTPRDAHLFATPMPLGSSFQVLKEPGSTWFPSSPSVEVTILQATMTAPGGGTPTALALALEGFLAASVDPNDDSLSVWPEIQGLPGTLPVGTRFDFRFQVSALAFPAATAEPSPHVGRTARQVGRTGRVNVFDTLTQHVVGSLSPFGRQFRGRMSVATADVNGDGFDDVIVRARHRGRRQVRAFDGRTLARLPNALVTQSSTAKSAVIQVRLD